MLCFYYTIAYLCTIKLQINIQTMKKIAENHPGSSLLGQLNSLSVGEQITVPVSRTSYLRSICTTFGLQWGRKFTTTTNREQRTITAT